MVMTSHKEADMPSYHDPCCLLERLQQRKLGETVREILPIPD
jgi:hypothetical protein